MLERRVERGIADASDERPAGIRTEQAELLRRARIEDELPDAILRGVELGHADADEALAGGNRHADEGRRELVGLIEQGAAVAVRTQPRPEAGARIRRHILEEATAAKSAARSEGEGRTSSGKFGLTVEPLTPEIARRYRLERNREVAMVNISVLRNGKSVAARISGVARDLLSREIALGFREVREPPAIYYLAQLRFTEQEHWRFRLSVQPVGEPAPMAVQFEQRIYVE